MRAEEPATNAVSKSCGGFKSTGLWVRAANIRAALSKAIAKDIKFTYIASQGNPDILRDILRSGALFES